MARTGGELSAVWELRAGPAAPVVVKVYAEEWRWSQEKDAYGYLTAEAPEEPEPTNAAYMTRQFTRKLAEFAELVGDPVLHRAVHEHVADRVGHFARCAAPVLCHNDFHEGNVLVDREHPVPVRHRRRRPPPG